MLNTSLNENEPVVRIPREAISCFLRTDMDVLVLGHHVLDRHAEEFPEQFRKQPGPHENLEGCSTKASD